MRIAIDVMGADCGPEAIIPPALRCAADYPQLELLFVGQAELVERNLSAANFDVDRVQIIHAAQAVEMDENPASALRHKKNSSMYTAINLVKDGRADACVSSGNTGALMAIARHLLRTLPGIDRPAIIKAMPAVGGRCYLLDLGANINCSAENLVQFAAMGSLMCEALTRKPHPRVGLLNIGEEESKGGTEVKLAAKLLKSNPRINYVGFIEGDGIYQGLADVVVCDGWVGNIALKTSEGLARFISQLIKEAFDASIMSRTAGLIAWPILEKLHEDLNPQLYNGASLLGLNGVVVKSHGDANEEGFYHAVIEAISMAEKSVPALIGRNIEEIMQENLH